MSAIERLKAVAGISIYNQLAPMFLRMAAVLHLDLCTINNLKTENNPVEGSKSMFKAWFAGKSAFPPTWDMLLEKLHACRMGELAKKIEHFFSRTSVTTPSPSLVSCVALHSRNKIMVLSKYLVTTLCDYPSCANSNNAYNIVLVKPFIVGGLEKFTQVSATTA